MIQYAIKHTFLEHFNPTICMFLSVKVEEIYENVESEGLIYKLIPPTSAISHKRWWRGGVPWLL